MSLRRIVIRLLALTRTPSFSFGGLRIRNPTGSLINPPSPGQWNKSRIIFRVIFVVMITFEIWTAALYFRAIHIQATDLKVRSRPDDYKAKWKHTAMRSLKKCLLLFLRFRNTVGETERKAELLACAENIVRTAHRMQDPSKLLLAKPVRFPHDFNFVIDHPQTCKERDIEVLFTVPSAPHYFQRRQDVRQSNRGYYASDPQNKAVLIFFLGLPSNDTDGEIQSEIVAEAARYGDIVQSDFVDIYHDIRLKAVSMLKWATTHCANARMVIRTDDDVNVTVNDLIGTMKRKSLTHSDYILGEVRIFDVPARNAKSKWFLSRKEYPHRVFPPYVPGGLIGYPMSTVQQLYLATMRVDPIWLDDVYVTGLCAEKLNIPVYRERLFTYAHDTPCILCPAQ